MDSLKRNFGLRVRELRKSAHMTQEQLAEKLGMDTPNVCRMENGTHIPQTKNLVKLAEILNVEIKELFEYAHLQSKSELVKKINSFLKTATLKDAELVYKFIKGLKEYKN